MAVKKLGHVVLKVRDLDRSEAFYAGVVGLRVTGRLPGRMVCFEDPDGNMLEFTCERPRESWPAGRNPFAGREPLPFETGRTAPRRGS